ncbi:polyketide synthase docking domain-containing protein [Streptomyces sp. KL116D]|uniref:polyketide synthase docking domain-containing protein n=1 Tax=Streptomyces sp. KL116D TaxID=3045152 RepID=UPI003555E78F
MTNDNDKVASYLRRATLDLRAARQRIQELEAGPIAIVGTACRLPGGIDTPRASGTCSRRARNGCPGSPTTAAGT